MMTLPCNNAIAQIVAKKMGVSRDIEDNDGAEDSVVSDGSSSSVRGVGPSSGSRCQCVFMLGRKDFNTIGMNLYDS